VAAYPGLLRMGKLKRLLEAVRKVRAAGEKR